MAREGWTGRMIIEEITKPWRTHACRDQRRKLESVGDAQIGAIDVLPPANARGCARQAQEWSGIMLKLEVRRFE